MNWLAVRVVVHGLRLVVIHGLVVQGLVVHASHWKCCRVCRVCRVVVHHHGGMVHDIVHTLGVVATYNIGYYMWAMRHRWVYDCCSSVSWSSRGRVSNGGGGRVGRHHQ